MIRKNHAKQDKPYQKDYKKNFYFALLKIYQVHEFRDLVLLQSSSFYKLCEVNAIQWNFNKETFFAKTLKKQKEEAWPFSCSFSLKYKSDNYGDILFFSTTRFLSPHKTFLKKISRSIASSLYFLIHKQTMQTIKKEWGSVFDSFSQAFCMTDKNLNIIEYNQYFQKISHKTENLKKKSLIDVFPILNSLFPKEEKEGSLLFSEKQNHWKISFKTFLLKKYNVQVFLFLIKDISKEKKIEDRLSSQAKKRELGFIKGSLAHELNNPVAGMQILLEVLEKKISTNKSLVIDSIKEMQKSVQDCQKVINKLLSVSKEKKDQSLF